jgi:hypothetical protein
LGFFKLITFWRNYLFFWVCRNGHLMILIFCFVSIDAADIEHLMSIKELKLLGIKSNYMISCKTPKISRGFTVKFIFSRHWNTVTLWNFTHLGLILQIGISILSLNCLLLVLLDSEFSL